MGNYPDGMTQQDHDREFDRKPEDEPEKFFWYEFTGVTITLRAKSRTDAINMLGCVRVIQPNHMDIDMDIDKIVESEE